ncbi:MAG: amidohydrolase family protein, partial [Acidobacteria bacterium]|nr:amidohydrolase family protein [Acidobacteriota bacterium]
MIIDIYTHILPDRFFREMSRASPKLENIGARLRGVKKLFDLDLRFAEMDTLDDCRQVISLPNPPLEEIAQGETAALLARVANDAMAELCEQHPKRFPAFVAAVSLDDVDAALKEAERAIETLGARGIQIFTNIAGHPLDEERFRP